VLLAGHGVLAWGDSVEQAYLRLELVEHLARIALVARQLGGVKPLSSAVVPQLLDARAKAGLGAPPSEKAPEKKVVVACAPAPPGSDVEVYDPKKADLASIIRQEIVAALRKEPR
jgi:L-fuculose-phosphate aldolase